MSQLYYLPKDMAVFWQDIPISTMLKFRANFRAKISNAKIRRIPLESVWYVFLPANLYFMVRIYKYIK